MNNNDAVLIPQHLAFGISTNNVTGMKAMELCLDDSLRIIFCKEETDLSVSTIQ
jgi:hypothetical protein